jgi:hypothetical protein
MEACMRRILIGLGLVLVLAGLAWPWIQHLGLGRLPGDLVVRRPGFTLYVPITTCLLISALLTLIAWVFRR